MTAPTLEPIAIDRTRRARRSHLQWLRISEISPSPKAQREFKPAWAAHMAAHFDLEGLGFLVVNKRDDHYYCIDGQHRLDALKQIGFGDDTVQCEVYEGLSEKEEAEMFLLRNDQKTVGAYDKFSVAVIAERQEDSEIRRLVMAQGLTVSASGGISCVGALRKAYRRQGPAGFSKTLRVIRDAYGEAGFRANVIDGLSLFLHRYDGQVVEGTAIDQLGTAHAGVNGLLGIAAKEREATKAQVAQCIAATATTIYNRAKGKKLAPWWKS
jgi:hypothetical protein